MSMVWRHLPQHWCLHLEVTFIMVDSSIKNFPHRLDLDCIGGDTH